MPDTADGIAADALGPVDVLAVTGSLPLNVLEHLCGFDEIAEAERHGRILIEPSGAATVSLTQGVPEPLTAARIKVIRRVAAALVSAPTPKTNPDISMRLARLLQEAGRFDTELIRDGARAALLRGDAATSLELSRHGLTHEPANVDLLHLQAMALESMGRHGAATGIDAHRAGMGDPAWLGRWASNLFLSTGRTADADRLPPLDDEQHEMKAALAWIDALQGDVAVVARSVNQIIDDPRSSPQAVVWACVAGAVPAALDGRGRVAEAMIAHCRSVVAELGDRLTPFADLQIGLAEALTQVRLGRLGDAVACCEETVSQSDAPFIAAVWSFFAAIARREMGDFDSAISHFRRGFAVVEADPFGLMPWARSEAQVCAAMVDRASAVVPAEIGSTEGHGLFRSCLLRNAAWTHAACGDIDEAIDFTLRAVETGFELGQQVHAALALFDLARFGEPHRASTMLVGLSEFDAGTLVVTADAIGALESGDTDRLVLAAAALRRLGMDLQAGELVHRARFVAARQANPCHIARLDLLDEPTIRPTPIFDEYERVAVELTRREREIARHCVAGLASRDIAHQLGISTRTVDNLLGRVYRKCALEGRHELQGWYERCGSGSGAGDETASGQRTQDGPPNPV